MISGHNAHIFSKINSTKAFLFPGSGLFPKDCKSNITVRYEGTQEEKVETIMMIIL